MCVCARACVRACVGLEGGGGCSRACLRVCVCSDESSDGYSGRRNAEYPALSNASLLRDGVHLEDLIYLND